MWVSVGQKSRESLSSLDCEGLRSWERGRGRGEPRTLHFRCPYPYDQPLIWRRSHVDYLFVLGSKKEVPINLLCYDAAVPIPPILIDKTFTRMEERSFLRQFYLETGGNNWYLQYGWSLSNASQMTSRSVDHCNWTGVICKEGYVIGLTLNMNNLTGTVPEFLWKFRNLMIICLPNNKLYGELKNFIFPNMTKLLRIDLARGHLSGSLPDDFFANLKSLVKVRLCCQKSSKLQGSIPKSIVELKHLRVLSLGENKFSGTIPRGIGKLNKVWFLDLEFMPRLYGNIKWFIGMTSLQQMHLSGAGNLFCSCQSTPKRLFS